MTQANALNSNLVSYTSPAINLKVTGLTTIFTTQYGMRFVPLEYYFICDSATVAVGNSGINIGWTGAGYTDFQTGVSFSAIVANDFYNTISFGVPLPVFPAATPIIANVTMADAGVALTGRIVFVGFYI